MPCAGSAGRVGLVERRPSEETTSMAGLVDFPIRSTLRGAVAICAWALIALPLTATPGAARGPEGIADVAEQVTDAVVNISTSQKVESRGGGGGGGAGPQ